MEGVFRVRVQWNWKNFCMGDSAYIIEIKRRNCAQCCSEWNCIVTFAQWKNDPFTFAISLNPNEDSTCNIKHGSHLVKLIARSKLIIWDETPMMHKHCFEALDKTMRDILQFVNPNSSDMPFGGKKGSAWRTLSPNIACNSNGKQAKHSACNNQLILFVEKLHCSAIDQKHKAAKSGRRKRNNTNKINNSQNGLQLLEMERLANRMTDVQKLKFQMTFC